MYTYVALWVCLPKKWKTKLNETNDIWHKIKISFIYFIYSAEGSSAFQNCISRKTKYGENLCVPTCHLKKTTTRVLTFEYLNEIFQQSFTRSISPAGPWWCNESTRSRTHNSLLNFFWIEIIYNFMCPWWRLCRKLVPGLFLYL